MANIVYNGDFQKPLIGSGEDIYYTTMTPQQQSDFYWIGTGNYLIHLNRDFGYYEYPTPPTGVSPQYVSFQSMCSLYQSIIISNVGRYALTFYVCGRPNYPTIEGLDILLDDVLITAIPSTITKSWTLFRIEFNITHTGNQILKFQHTNSSLN